MRWWKQLRSQTSFKIILLNGLGFLAILYGSYIMFTVHDLLVFRQVYFWLSRVTSEKLIA